MIMNFYLRQEITPRKS